MHGTLGPILFFFLAYYYFERSTGPNNAGKKENTKVEELGLEIKQHNGASHFSVGEQFKRLHS
jgi:hypothetical protein